MTDELMKELLPYSGLPRRSNHDRPTPVGFAYVPSASPPDNIDPTTHKATRTLTPTSFGWTSVALTQEELEELKPKPVPTSKLTLMRRLSDLGKWTQFKGMLTSLPEEVQEAWGLAQEISITDPLFLAYESQIKGYLTLTDTEFTSLFLPKT